MSHQSFFSHHDEHMNKSPFKTPRKVLFKSTDIFTEVHSSFSVNTAQEMHLFSNFNDQLIFDEEEHYLEKTPSVKNRKKRNYHSVLTPKPAHLDRHVEPSLSPFKKLSIHSNKENKELYCPKPFSPSLLHHWTHKKSKDRQPLKSLDNHSNKNSLSFSKIAPKPIDELKSEKTLFDYFPVVEATEQSFVIEYLQNEFTDDEKDTSADKALTMCEGFINSPMSEKALINLGSSPLEPCSPLSQNAHARAPFALKRSKSLFIHDRDFPSIGFLPINATIEEESSLSFSIEQTKYSLLTPALSPSLPIEMDNGERCQLPFVETGKDALKRISADTLKLLIDGQYDSLYDEKYIIDCRFPYEYKGGHIRNAININTMDHLEALFFRNHDALSKRQHSAKRTIIVFHCEFSSHRAPRMALHFRKRDRLLNLHQYPILSFPEIYILKGGYKEFYETQKLHCEPQQYVEMNHENYKNELRSEWTRFKKSWNRSKSFCHISSQAS